MSTVKPTTYKAEAVECDHSQSRNMTSQNSLSDKEATLLVALCRFMLNECIPGLNVHLQIWTHTFEPPTVGVIEPIRKVSLHCNLLATDYRLVRHKNVLEAKNLYYSSLYRFFKNTTNIDHTGNEKYVCVPVECCEVCSCFSFTVTNQRRII